MNKNMKLILIVVGIAFTVAMAGCLDNLENQNDGPDGGEIESQTNVNLTGEIGESYWFEVRATEKNQHGLVEAQPPFELDYSLERQNLIERYQHLNDRNNVHHVYLLSMDGKVVSYYTAQGKVSSVNSKLTNDRQIVHVSGCGFDGGNGAGGSKGPCYKTVESPQMDGSYGENGDAVFFFTTSGEYVEWNGWYLVSEEPKNIQTQVTLVEDVGEDDSDEDE